MIKNPYALTPEAARKREADIDSLFSVPYIKTLLKSMNKEGDREFLERNSARFKAYLKELSQCKGCMGLDLCPHSLPGRVKELYMDPGGYLSDRYVPCKYARQKQESLAHKAMYKICDMSDEDLQLDPAGLDLSRESGSYTQSLFEVLKSQEEGKGIYLFGEPGTGKSFILKCLANKTAKNQIRVSFVNTAKLISDLKNHMNDDDYRQRTFNILQNSPVLILDDLGAEYASAWSRDLVLFPLLDYRMHHHQKTYFTSNYSLQDLEDYYTLKNNPAEKVAVTRLMERIKTLSKPVLLTGHSRRN